MLHLFMLKVNTLYALCIIGVSKVFLKTVFVDIQLYSIDGKAFLMLPNACYINRLLISPSLNANQTADVCTEPATV